MYTEQELKDILRNSIYSKGTIKAAIKFLAGFAPSKQEYVLESIAKGVLSHAEH